ncbi:PXMP2/4 family protein [Paramyrothecium foliicola]|nr:PXMP2/4 family protein [Paramyrothecium foliicola]
METLKLPTTAIASIQSAILAAVSSLIAHVITARRQDVLLHIDWVSLYQFTLFSFLSTYPNILWQEYLESRWPAYHLSPAPSSNKVKQSGHKAPPAASAKVETLPKGKLNVPNTLIKLILDQTIGAAANILAFSIFMHTARQATYQTPQMTCIKGSDTTLCLGPVGVDYNRVDWQSAWNESIAEFWPIIFAGWKLWPFVSLVNFVLVKTVAMRSLVGNLAGLCWNTYLNLLDKN